MIRTVGIWMALVMGVLQALNVFRAFSDPAGFADYMGLPLAPADTASFVYVYGLRTAFIAALVLLLVSLRRFDTLALVALVALVMPLGDAYLAWQAEATGSIVARHLVIALYVLLVAVFLRPRETGQMVRG